MRSIMIYLFQFRKTNQHFPWYITGINFSCEVFGNGTQATISGWGCTECYEHDDCDNHQSTRLIQLRVKVIDNSLCSIMLSPTQIYDSQICAVSLIGYPENFSYVSATFYNNFFQRTLILEQ